MIIIEQVNQHIIEIDRIVIGSQVTKRLKTQLATVRSNLVSVVMILDTTSELAIDRMHESLKNKLNSYEFSKREVPHDYYRKQTLADLEAQYNPKLLRRQLMAMNYILQKNNDLLCGLLSPSSL